MSRHLPQTRHRGLALVLTTGMLVGCGGKAPADETPAPSPTTAAPQTSAEGETSAPGEPLYGADGKLLPSDEFLAGLRLPRGLRFFRKDNLESIYRTEVPLKDVLAYFGPLLTTGKVDRIGDGAIYRRATVRGAEMNPTKVEVSILPAGQLTRIAILQIPPSSKNAPPVQETRAQYYKRARMLD